jgi:ATP phosphoribosyltransferase regulatory subunit
MQGVDPIAATSKLLNNANLPVVTDRSVADVAERLAEKLADRSQTPLDVTMVKTIESYLTIEGSAADVVAQLNVVGGGSHFKSAISTYEKRVAALEDQGLNPRRFHFSANFGRELEYYTGFVFQIDRDAHNTPLTVAGGGRYDNLLRDLGATRSIPAVGCAIHTERVKAVMP